MAAQQLHRAAVRCPRRPHWTAQMNADELDAQERASFLTWRRALAR
jgi:large subunit GTPase 1